MCDPRQKCVFFLYSTDISTNKSTTKYNIIWNSGWTYNKSWISVILCNNGRDNCYLVRQVRIYIYMSLTQITLNLLNIYNRTMVQNSHHVYLAQILGCTCSYNQSTILELQAHLLHSVFIMLYTHNTCKTNNSTHKSTWLASLLTWHSHKPNTRSSLPFLFLLLNFLIHCQDQQDPEVNLKPKFQNMF